LSPLKGLKRDLQVHQLCDEIALERLEEPAVAEYLQAEFPNANLPAELANLIHRHSDGNALFMVAIVQDMIKKGLIAESKGSWKLTKPLADIDPGVPDTLQLMLEGQFDQLGEPEQRILQSASVAGERFSVWSVSSTSEMDSEQIERRCESL